MKISIIIPVYNVKDYLPKCMDSVLAQDCTDIEVILVDDGSTDGESGRICDDYAEQYPQLVRTIHQANRGLGGARNTGLEAARGEYLFFVDSDDYLAPETLDKLRATIEEFESDIITFGFVIDENGTLTERHLDDLPVGRAFALTDTKKLLLAAPNAWTRVWKKSLFLESGIRYPERVWYEDIRTTMKLFALAKSVVYLPETFYRYVVREGSITRNINVERNREILEAFDDLLGWYQAKGLFETYRAELEALTVYHVLMTASVRVLRIDPKSELLGQFYDYTEKHFPDWKRNPYRKTWPTAKRLALFLVEHHCYRLLAALFRVK